MQTLEEISHLPHASLNELATIQQIILAHAHKILKVEMIILYWSYARGDFVISDVSKEGGHLVEYQSDYDILIIVKKPVYELQMRLQNEIENSLQKERAICTPVSIIVEDIKHINARLEENRYFYSDIKREGILLYDSKKYILAQPKILTVSEKKIMQQEDFETWHDSGNSALRFVSFWMDNELTNDSAFLLHQASERYITAYTLVKTGYKPKTHNLKVLYTKLQEIEPAFALRFDLANSKEKYHFVLLQKAYIEARYSKAFAITTDELSFIQNKVKLLAKMVKKFCELEIGA